MSVTARTSGISITRSTWSPPTSSAPNSPVRKARVAEEILDREGAAGHVRGVLQHARVPGHHRGRGEAEDLPEREVPRHHGEDHAERLERHVALRDASVASGSGDEEGVGVLGVVPADPGALLRLGDPLRDGLSHLARHEEREGVLPLVEERSRLGASAFARSAKLEPAPRLEGAVRLLDDPGRLGRRASLRKWL